MKDQIKPMKNQIIRSLLVVALAAVPGAIQAQNDAHYGVGFEGIKGSTLPPPGFYLRDYNIIYVANDINNAAGHNIAPGNFQGLVYVQVPRLIYISDIKVLGGYIGADLVPLFEYVSLKNAPLPKPPYGPGGLFTGSKFGIADAYTESTLQWHPGQFDIGAAVGVNMPTGTSGQPDSPGLGYWGPQLTLGVTWYPDEAKTWAVSALNRYEFNSEDRDLHAFHVTPGEAYTLEWAVSKTLKDVNQTFKAIDLGVVGYYQQRVTASTGDQPVAEMFYPYSRVAAIGPEINVDFPFVMASLRYNYEFMADNRMQWNTITLTLTKRF